MASDETSLENFTPQERDELAALAQGLSRNPKTRDAYLRLIKQHAPDTPIPEIDVIERTRQMAKPLVDKVLAMEAKELEREVKGRIADKRNELRDDGYSKDEIEAIEKLMVERQIPNHKTAGEFFRMQRQSAQPTPSSYTMPRVPLPDKAKAKEAGGYKRFFQQDAHAAIDDLRAGRVKLH